MHSENHFNLIDEPWIPIVDVGKVSLKQVFLESGYRAIGGNPVQKIALTKLLLAIAQAAFTPEDDEAWQELQPEDLAKKCLAYLVQWHGQFYLYGDTPFLQMPAIKTAFIQKFGAVLPEISTGNTTVLTQSQAEKKLSNGDKALLIVQLMGFGLGGKKTDNSVVLTKGYQGKLNEKTKPSTGKPGPSIGFLGFLHSFLQGSSLQETLWLNVLTQQQIADMGIFPAGLGIAPWQQMPEGENCATAESLKASLMGRLIPLSRFCLLAEQGLHYSEGIAHSGYKEGIADPSTTIDRSGKEAKALWTDPEKRPWRQLTALLSFLSSANNRGADCYQLRLTTSRASNANPALKSFGIWSGGLRVSSNAGEQFVSGSDDFVESLIQLPTDSLGEKWFSRFQTEMGELDTLSKIIYGATLSYFKSQNMEAKGQAALASNLFWQLCERQFQALVSACADTDTTALKIRTVFAQFVQKSYDSQCANDTARQLDAWARHRPNLSLYLKNTNQER
jgi:CRISPR system Cascade subunit CasA